MMRYQLTEKGSPHPANVFFLFLHDKLIHRDNNDDEKGNQLTVKRNRKKY